jgi:hypothetical protein
MQSRRQCLDILGLNHQTTDEREIRRQYMKLCLLLHPDKNLNDDNSNNNSNNVKFHQVVNAYNYLVNRGLCSDEKYFYTTVLASKMAEGTGKLHLQLFRCLIPYYKNYVQYAKYLFRHGYKEQFNELKIGIDDMLGSSLFHYDLDYFDDFGDLLISYETWGYLMSFPDETLRQEKIQTGLELDLWLPDCNHLEELMRDKHVIFDENSREYETLDHDQYLSKYKLVYCTLTLQDKIDCLNKYCIVIDDNQAQSNINKIDNILMKYKIWL